MQNIGEETQDAFSSSADENGTTLVASCTTSCLGASSEADSHAPSDELIDAIQSITWRDGAPSVFVAGEFSVARLFRTYFRKERPTRKDLTYVSSYWKLGLIEPEHKAFKAQIAA